MSRPCQCRVSQVHVSRFPFNANYLLRYLLWYVKGHYFTGRLVPLSGEWLVEVTVVIRTVGSKATVGAYTYFVSPPVPNRRYTDASPVVVTHRPGPRTSTEPLCEGNFDYK